ncbi:MAG: phosphotransferase [Chloroflexia bacterium]
MFASDPFQPTDSAAGRPKLDAAGEVGRPSRIPTMRSLLSPAALGAEAERTYNIGDIEDCTLLRSLTNDVYEVSAAGGRYVLKVYGHGWRSAEEVGWKVDLIAHLSRKGLAVEPALYVRTEVTSGHWRRGGRPTRRALWVRGGGQASAPSSPLYYEFGRFVGRMHTASADFSSTHPRVAFDVAGSVEDSLQAVLPLLSEREDREFVASLLNRAHERVAGSRRRA